MYCMSPEICMWRIPEICTPVGSGSLLAHVMVASLPPCLLPSYCGVYASSGDCSTEEGRRGKGVDNPHSVRGAPHGCDLSAGAADKMVEET